MSADVAASVKARLLKRAKAQREEFERTLVRYATERLLYRLGVSAVRDRLKGASLLTVWMRDPYRATRDVDLLSFGSAADEAIRALVEEVCAVPCPEDGLRFDVLGWSSRRFEAWRSTPRSARASSPSSARRAFVSGSTSGSATHS